MVLGYYIRIEYSMVEIAEIGRVIFEYIIYNNTNIIVFCCGYILNNKQLIKYNFFLFKKILYQSIVG